MVKSNSQLFGLVQSLTSGEKKEFQKFASRHTIGEKNLYLELFEGMLTQSTYDERALRGIWGEDQPERRFPLAKNYLIGLVLESLRRQHRGKTMSMYLREQLDYVELLFQKGQRDLAQRWLTKTRKKANALSETVAELELIRWEKRLVRSRAGDKIGEDLDRLVQEEAFCLQQIQAETQLQGIRDQMFGIIVQRVNPREPHIQSRLSEWMTHPLLKNAPTELTREAQLAYYFVFVYHHQMRGEYASLLDQYRAMFRIWEDWPEKQRWEAQRYINTLYLYLDSCYLAGKSDEFEESLPMIQEFKPREKKDQAQKFTLVNHLRFRYYLNAGKFQEAAWMEPELRSGLQKYKRFLNPNINLTFHYNLAILFFILSDYEKSLTWINQILHHKNIDARSDLQAVSRILSLICHFELEHWDQLPTLLTHAKRYLTSRFSSDAFVQSFIRGLSELYKTPTTEHSAIWERMQEELIEIMSGMEPPLICVEEIRAWLLAHCGPKTVQEILYERKNPTGKTKR